MECGTDFIKLNLLYSSELGLQYVYCVKWLKSTKCSQSHEKLAKPSECYWTIGASRQAK